MYSPNDYGADWKVYKNGKWTDRKDEKTGILYREWSWGQWYEKELVKAIRENKPEVAVSNFDYAGNMTEAILLGNAAMRAGGKFTWDARI